MNLGPLDPERYKYPLRSGSLEPQEPEPTGAGWIGGQLDPERETTPLPSRLRELEGIVS